MNIYFYSLKTMTYMHITNDSIVVTRTFPNIEWKFPNLDKLQVL
jgi:hypothetical protein